MSVHAAIHSGLKQLGIDQDAARDLYARVTGKRSLREMSPTEHQRIVEELRRAGFKTASNGSRKPLQGKYGKKLQALWIDAWNLGIARNRDDHALLAFVKRQTGLDHARFLHHADDARKAIEALKAWMEREGGVDWKESRFQPAWTQTTGYRVATAQWAILKARSHPLVAESELVRWAVENGHVDFTEGEPTSRQWIAVMNALGQQVRKVKS